ncbi:MAG: hypothetical protein AAFN11_19595, partial [Chloroflexota bacterium]
MSALGMFVCVFFIVWMLIFFAKTYVTYRAGRFQIPAVRDLWPMTLGVGIGIFIYNYELEYWLQSHLSFLPFSVTSLRAFVSIVLVVLVYYRGVNKYTQFRIDKRIQYFLVACMGIILAIDVVLHERYPYEQFQVWMTLLIIPPILVASALVSGITRTILREEVAPLNRAHYYWWVIELIASSLSALIFLGDAIYKVSTQNYTVYTPAVMVAQGLYLVLAMAAHARIVLPPRYTRYVFYAEKLLVYLRLRFIRDKVERKAQIQQVYNYERYWLPTYERLELEIQRSFINIMDAANYLHDVDPHLGAQFDTIRKEEKPFSEAVDDIL